MRTLPPPLPYSIARPPAAASAPSGAVSAAALPFTASNDCAFDQQCIFTHGQAKGNSTLSRHTSFAQMSLPPAYWLKPMAITEVQTRSLDLIFYYARALGQSRTHGNPEARGIEHQIDTIATLLESLKSCCPFVPHEIEIRLLMEPTWCGLKICGRNMIVIDQYHPYYQNTILHEIGHMVFDKADSVPWRILYHLALRNRANVDLVKDSTFIQNWAKADLERNQGWPSFSTLKASLSEPGSGPGHPWDNPTELFASTFHAYTAFPDEFVNRISAPTTPADVALFGRLVFLYLRDEVFFGKHFLEQADPFQDTSFRSELVHVKLATIVSAITTRNPEIEQLLHKTSSQRRGRGDTDKIIPWLETHNDMNVLHFCNRHGWRSFPSFLL